MNNYNTCNHNSCVSKVPLFSELDPIKLSELEKLVISKQYKNGEVIYAEEEPGEYIYIIDSGLVKLYKTGKDGNEYILRLLKAGQFFGEMVLFKKEKLSSSAESVGDCNICMIGKKDLENLIRSNLELSYKLLSSISIRLNKTENKLISFALEDAREKTMRLLLDLAQESGIKREDGVLVKLPLNRQGLANLMGISQETLSRKFTELQNEGIIYLLGQRQVLLKNK